jgi:hypothetical protein
VGRILEYQVNLARDLVFAYWGDATVRDKWVVFGVACVLATHQS